MKKLTVAALWSRLWMERAISTCGPWHVDEYDPVLLDDRSIIVCWYNGMMVGELVLVLVGHPVCVSLLF